MAETKAGLTVAIIGGGAAGTLTALNFSPVSSVSRIIMFDGTNRFGRGLAYSAQNPWHRINVPAQKMGGCFEDDPTGFEDWWLNGDRNDIPYHQLFSPRSSFGDFLAARLQPLVDQRRVELVPQTVSSIDPAGKRHTVRTQSGAAIEADIVVLCLGNHAPTDLPGIPQSERVIQDVWSPGAFDRIKAGERVLVVGTAATAVDAVLELHHRKLNCHVTMVSRRGLLPLEDVPPLAEPLTYTPPPKLTVTSLLRDLRALTRQHVAPGTPWQAVVDAFRLELSSIWQKLPEIERHRFGRHLRSIWLVHRHRLAPDVASLLRDLCEQGRLSILAARIRQARDTGQDFALTLHIRQGGLQELCVDKIINCTGPNERYETVDNPVARALLASGQARPGPNGLGLDVSQQLELIGTDGKPSRTIFAIGPATRGTFWEVTAAPNIRRQAIALAKHIQESGMRSH